ncbi:MAG: alpha/beta hydrolase [Bacteroidetes bacterium]|nr:alpha/beta hydrolase [Bacteroidota bacterium]
MIQTNQLFDYKGHHIAYHESGNGSPMIMMHNGGCSHIIWKNQIEHFSKTHRVIAFDMLGFGDSARPKMYYTLPLYVDILRHFIADNQLDQPVLMGNCIGAAVALEYASQHPKKARALVLCNVCGGAAMMRYFHPYMFTRQEGSFSEGFYKLAFSVSKLEFVKEKVVARLYGSSQINKDEVYQGILEGMRHPLQPQSRIKLIKGLHTFNKFNNYRDNPKGLPPTMIAWGGDNQVLPVKRGQLLMERVQPDLGKVYEGQGHLLMVEAAEEFNEDIERFLD